jgi:hypothetical protein
MHCRGSVLQCREADKFREVVSQVNCNYFLCDVESARHAPVTMATGLPADSFTEDFDSVFGSTYTSNLESNTFLFDPSPWQ